MATREEIKTAVNNAFDGLKQEVSAALAGHADDIKLRVQAAMTNLDTKRAEVSAKIDAWVAEHQAPKPATEA